MSRSFCIHWKPYRQRRAAALAGLDMHFTSKHTDALCHTDQTKRGRLSSAFGNDADPVVGHFQFQTTAIAVQIDADLGRMRMSCQVVQLFLQDTKKPQCNTIVQITGVIFSFITKAQAILLRR